MAPTGGNPFLHGLGDELGAVVHRLIDGAPLTFEGCNCTRLMSQTMHSSQSMVGFYLLPYRERGMFDTFDVYYDAVRRRTAIDQPDQVAAG